MMDSYDPNHDGVGMFNIRPLIRFASLFITLAVLALAHAGPTVAQGHPSCANITYETPQTPECDAVMAALPYPDVTPIPYDLGVIAGKDFIYFDTDTVTLYDMPGGKGKVVETLTAGRSTYVHVRQISGDWVEIRPSRWAALEHAQFAEPSTFTGVTINRMEMPFAWAIYDHCTSRTPGGPRSCQQSGSFNRYDLMNIYATVTVGEWNWHLVGPGQWTVQTNLSIVYPTPPVVYSWRWVGVSTYEQNLVAYEGERPVMALLWYRPAIWMRNSGGLIRGPGRLSFSGKLDRWQAQQAATMSMPWMTFPIICISTGGKRCMGSTGTITSAITGRMVVSISVSAMPNGCGTTGLSRTRVFTSMTRHQAKAVMPVSQNCSRMSFLRYGRPYCAET
jgi:hypothetical protein